MRRLLTALLIVAPLASAGHTSEPATEAEFRDAVQHAERLARGLQFELKRYRQHLHAAMLQQGYGLHHPLFRTSVNGFKQNQVDLDDLDEFKMGRFAFQLQTEGKTLEPDPFLTWTEVRNWLAQYQTTMDDARSVVARTGLFVAHGEQNIPREVFERLNKRWRKAVQQAALAYQHAAAVRAVEFEDGAMVPAEANVRLIPGGGRYAGFCAFKICTSGPPNANGEVRRIGP
jgi:hypothetical protein